MCKDFSDLLSALFRCWCTRDIHFSPALSKQDVLNIKYKSAFSYSGIEQQVTKHSLFKGRHLKTLLPSDQKYFGPFLLHVVSQII